MSSPSSTTSSRTSSSAEHEANPYRPGRTLVIRQHIPPEPFQINGHYRDNPRPVADLDHWETRKEFGIDRLEFALAHPPMENETHPACGTALERSLTITGRKTRRRHDGSGQHGGAHVLTCFLDGDTTTEYIAKIYDGIDYPGSYDEPDCMTLADMDYSIEACAYQNLQPISGVGGVLVPAYFGSWTFALDVPDPKPDPGSGHSKPAPRQRQRWVRMILLELIPGKRLLDMIEPAKVPIHSPDQATEWLVATFRDDARFTPLSQRFLNSYTRTECSPRALELLEGLGRKLADKDEEREGR